MGDNLNRRGRGNQSVRSCIGQRWKSQLKRLTFDGAGSDRNVRMTYMVFQQVVLVEKPGVILKSVSPESISLRLHSISFPRAKNSPSQTVANLRLNNQSFNSRSGATGISEA